MKLFSKNYFIFFILLIICLSIYANTLKNDFVFDDIDLIIKNAYIKNVNFIPLLLITDIYQFSLRKSNYYRPLQMFTYAIDYCIWTLNPFGYHMTNIFLHASVAYLLFFFISKLFSSRQIALFSSLLFAVHPIHTTVVAYIASRADILATLFLMITLITFFEYINKLKLRFLLISIISYLLALLSRENALILPIIILSFITIAQNKKMIILKHAIPFFIIVCFYMVLRFETGTIPSSIIFRVHIPFKLWMVNFLHAIKEYTFLIFFPTQLRVSRVIPFTKNIDFFDLVIIFILLLFFLTIIRKRNMPYQRQLTFLVLWIVIALSPLIKLIFFYPHQGMAMAENWLYVPCIGIFSLAGYVFSKTYKKYVSLSLSLFILIFVFYSFITIKSNSVWQNKLKFYNYLIDTQPTSNTFKFNRALIMADNGSSDEAIQELHKIIKDEPKAWDAYLAIGNIYFADKKDMENALANYYKALEVKPNSDLAYLNIGIAQIAKGEKEKAIDNLLKALEINPELWQGYFHLGNLCEEKKLHQIAIKCYKKVIELNPTFTQAYVNLGIAYGNAGQFKKAIDIWGKSLKLGTDNEDIKANIKKAYELLKSNKEHTNLPTKN